MQSYINRNTIYRLKTVIKNDTQCRKTFDGFIVWNDLCNVYSFNPEIIAVLGNSYKNIFEVADQEGNLSIRLYPLARRLDNNGTLANHVRNVLPPELFHGTSDERVNEILRSGALYPGIDGFINFSDTVDKARVHAIKKYTENHVRIIRILPRALARHNYNFFYYHGLFRGTEKIGVNYIDLV